MALWDIKERYDIIRSNQIRPGEVLYGGGNTGSASNIIDFISITTVGDAVDFGDLLEDLHLLQMLLFYFPCLMLKL